MSETPNVQRSTFNVQRSTPGLAVSQTVEDREAFTRGRGIGWVMVLVVVCVLAYFNSLLNGFIWDDERHLVGNIHITTLAMPSRFFTVTYWMQLHPLPGLYRPLWMLSYAVDYRLWGLLPLGYHFTSMMAHALATAFAFGAFRAMGVSARLAALASLLFAVNPVHVELVVWIKNRAALLACMFYLLACGMFGLWARRHTEGTTERTRHEGHEERPLGWLWYAAALAAFVCALLSQSVSVTLPLTLTAYLWVACPGEQRWRRLRATLPFWALTFAYLAFRVVCTHGIIPQRPPPQPALISRFLVPLRTVAEYFGLALFPVYPCADRPFSLTAPATLHAWLTALGIVALLAVVLGMTFQRSPRLRFWVLWPLITLLPVANLGLITGRPIAEQRLYLPSAGYSVLLAALLLKMTERGRRLAFAVAVLVLMLLAAGLVDRSFAWRTSATFWADTVAKSPRQGRDHYYYGVNCLGRGRTKAAFHHFQTAVAVNPHLTDAYDEMAKLHAARKEWDEAEACARKATTISPWWPEGHNTLGVVFGLQGRYAEAAAAFNEALRIQPAHADARRNLALAYRKLGLADQAARAARPVTMPFSTGRKAGSGPAVTWSPE